MLISIKRKTISETKTTKIKGTNNHNNRKTNFENRGSLCLTLF